jgi:hypothetical protein
LASATTAGVDTCFDFLKPPPDGGISASAAGFAISLRRCPGTIWLCIVLDSSYY